ncbi:MAG: endonuclease III, partial [Candidatus Thermoplasmatota archaeon]|nr:endonuclease III [Candidatus Thermoplasmatota archaeon]
YRAKARGVIEASKALLERYDGQVPRDLDALLALPMVGRKTANCVLVYGFGDDAMPVDTHVHRISNRLGWVDTKDPDKTEMVLRKLVPKEYWKELNSLMIDFGRKTCQPRRPRCPECPVEHICPSSIVPK